MVLKTKTKIKTREGVRVSWHDQPVIVPGIERKYWNTETAFQIYCATWLRKTYPDLMFHHSANERDSGSMGLRAKLMGQAKGFPDFLIFGSVMGAYELKLPNGVVTTAQVNWLAYLESIGWEVGVIRSFQEFREVVSRAR